LWVRDARSCDSYERRSEASGLSHRKVARLAEELLGVRLSPRSVSAILAQLVLRYRPATTVQVVDEHRRVMKRLADLFAVVEIPLGLLHQRQELAPDIEVVPTDEDIELRRDVQLFAAIDYLRESVQAAVP